MKVRRTKEALHYSKSQSDKVGAFQIVYAYHHLGNLISVTLYMYKIMLLGLVHSIRVEEIGSVFNPANFAI